LGSLTIDPREQNQGLGRKLLAAAENWISERGGREVRMTVVNVCDTLLAWYTRRGYAPTGIPSPSRTTTIASAFQNATICTLSCCTSGLQRLMLLHLRQQRAFALFRWRIHIGCRDSFDWLIQIPLTMGFGRRFHLIEDQVLHDDLGAHM